MDDIHMKKIIMLGTGHAVVTECFNTCFLLDCNNGESVLVDTGGGIGLLKQLNAASVNLSSIHDVFISHRHTDHFLGLFWLLRTMGRKVLEEDYGRPLTIYMAKELTSIARQAVELILPVGQRDQVGSRILFQSVDDREIGTLGGQKVVFYDTHSDNEEQFGFRMTFDDGQTLLFTGDVPLDERNYDLAQDIDWLMHDAFDVSKEGFGRKNKRHSTVFDAAVKAETVNAGNLILYHGTDRDIQNRKKMYIAEARQAYSGTVYAPDDLDTIILSKSKLF